MKKIKLRRMLTTIDVTTGKKKVVLPFLIMISPGNLPINDHINPMIRNVIPSIIKSLEIPIVILEPPYQSDHKLGELPFFHEVYVVRNRFEADMAHRHLRSYDFLHQS